MLLIIFGKTTVLLNIYLVSGHMTLLHVSYHGNKIRVIICDISKAFDRVLHRGLILKLHAVGISSSILDWFENYV